MMIDLSADQLRESINANERKIDIAVSSELPVDRWFGKEILDHATSSIRLNRLLSGGAVLLDHDPRSLIGITHAVSVDHDKKLRATVRLGNSDLANQALQDIQDKIRVHVSVGYRVHGLKLESSTTEEGDTYRVTDWEPYEISFVSIPADPSVGVGRSMQFNLEDFKSEAFRALLNAARKELKEPNQSQTTEVRKMTANAEVLPDTAKDTKEIQEKAQQLGGKNELARVTDIINIGETLGAATNDAEVRKIQDSAIKNGESVEDFQRKIIAHLSTRGKITQPQSDEVGLSEREIEKFSLVRLFNAMANPQDKGIRKQAAYEEEVCQAAASKRNAATQQPKGVLIPVDVMRHRNFSNPTLSHRDMFTTGAGNTNIIASNLLAGSYIDLLRNNTAVIRRATMLDDLVGNIVIPKQTGGCAVFWISAEGNDAQQTAPTFGQVALTPKDVAAHVDIGRRMLQQSTPSVEALVRSDLTQSVGLDLDRVAIEGNGTNEPRGIINTSGIGLVVGGTNGASPTWSHVVNLETQVNRQNAAFGNLAYITNSLMMGEFKKKSIEAGDSAKIWDRSSPQAPLNGHACEISEQIPSDLTKGTAAGICNAILFGNFANLLVGMWSGLDVLVDPYSKGLAGTVRIVVHQTMDVAVRYPQGFAAMLDALVTNP